MDQWHYQAALITDGKPLYFTLFSINYIPSTPFLAPCLSYFIQRSVPWMIFSKARRSICPWNSVYTQSRAMFSYHANSLASRTSPEGSRHLNGRCVLASPLRLLKLALVGMKPSSAQTSLLPPHPSPLFTSLPLFLSNT